MHGPVNVKCFPLFGVDSPVEELSHLNYPLITIFMICCSNMSVTPCQTR